MIIEVYRPKQFHDMARDYKLFADGKEVGIIKRGVRQTISLPSGAKVLQAKIDWCTSPEFELSELQSNKITIKNSFASNFIKAIVLPLYYITYGRNRYLTIESGF